MREKVNIVSEEGSVRQQTVTLKAKVYALVMACPEGKVTTYGWLAHAIGHPRGARMVGWIMNDASDRGVPAHRVINSKGELSGSAAFGQKGLMRQLLENEGIVFSADERVDLKTYGWNPSRDLSEEEIQQLFDAAPSTNEVGTRLLNLMHHDPASPFREKSVE